MLITINIIGIIAKEEKIMEDILARRRVEIDEYRFVGNAAIRCEFIERKELKSG